MSVDMTAGGSCRRYSPVTASAESCPVESPAGEGSRSVGAKVVSAALKTGKAVFSHGRTIIQDLTNKNLFVLKMIWFLEMAGVVTIWPYNSLHMQQLGLNNNDISVVQSASRMVGAVTPVVTGVVADYLGDFKIFLALVLVVEGLAGASVLLISAPGSSSVPPGPSAACFQQTINTSYISSINCTAFIQQESLSPSDSTCRGACTIGTILPRYVCQPIKCQYLTGDLGTLSNWPFASGNSTINCSGDDNMTCALTCSSHDHHTASCTSQSIAKNNSRRAGTALSVDVERNGTAVDNGTVLGWYVALRMLYSFGLASTYTLVDATTLSYCSRLDANYALQRVWGSLAAIVMAPLFGYLINVYSVGQQHNYSVAFIALLIIRLLCVPLLGPLTLKYRSKQSFTCWRKAGGILTNPDFLILLPIPIVLGMCTGFLETHVYIFLNKVGFSVTLIAGTISIGNSTEIVLLLTGTGAALRYRKARVLMLFMGTMVAGFRFIGLQFLQQPWTLLLLEAMDGVTGGILAPALMTSAIQLVPTDMIATMRGLLGTIIYGLAPVLGTLLSGQMITLIGYRWSFGLMGYLLLFTAVLFGVSWLLRQWHLRAQSQSGAPKEPSLCNGCQGNTPVANAANEENATGIDGGAQ